MNLLLDTNILLYIARDKSSRRVIRFINPADVIVYVSFTSIAEIESIALQQRWSDDKKNRVEVFLDNVRVIDITDLILKNYVDLDACSQRNHPEFLTYPFTTPRNMGKHDLWIAATASLLNLTLVTTDGDFDHLQNVFLDLRKILPEELRPLLQ
jgi:tRNA(fMet)-specific endonuclease VapC